MKCKICNAPQRAQSDYCRDCQQAPILRKLYEERNPTPRKPWWRRG